MMPVEEVLLLICQAAQVALDSANRTLEELGFNTPQARNLFRTKLRLALAESKLFVTNLQIPVDPEVTLRGIAQTIAFSVVTQPEPLRYGGLDVVQQPQFVRKRIFFATDRKTSAAGYFGSERDNSGLHLGTCEVSIPRDHKLAALEAPSIWKLEFRQNPEKHVVLLSVQSLPSAEFYAGISADIGAEKQAFVFVHGYNVSFEDGARRTAQLAYDLQFGGAPILFSWPSFHSMPNYPADEAAVEWSIPHLQEFLSSLGQTGAQRIHLIAHSMGNRALTRALQALSFSATQPTFDQIVLTAPDVDRGVFLQIADAIRKTGKRVTLYASTRDLALQASEFLHRCPRAGESGERILVLNGIDTVDASNVEADFVGHSYFGSNRSVVADLFDLFRTGEGPEKRFGLRRVDYSGACYWCFAK